MFIRRCIICHKLTNNKKDLCDQCLEKLENDKIDSYFVRCNTCNFPLISSDYKCENCKKENYLSVYSVSDYKSIFSREILERYKFYHDRTLISVVSDIFYQAFLEQKIDLKNSLIIPVPCSTRSFRKRGWDHMLEVSKYLNKKYKIPYLKLIKNIQRTKTQQKELTREQRIEASKQKYVVEKYLFKKALEFKQLILIDDIITTGSTLKECFLILSKNTQLEIKIFTWFIEL